ncbi:MAG TPA: hypothetical protein VIM84_14090 [Gemmatimonadales bacterium]
MPRPHIPAPPRRRGTGRPPKRSDLTTAIVLVAVRHYGTHAHFALTLMGWPGKVVSAALLREIDAGHLDCGFSTDRCWLTMSGLRRLEGGRR